MWKKPTQWRHFNEARFYQLCIPWNHIYIEQICAAKFMTNVTVKWHRSKYCTSYATRLKQESIVNLLGTIFSCRLIHIWYYWYLSSISILDDVAHWCVLVVNCKLWYGNFKSPFLWDIMAQLKQCSKLMKAFVWDRCENIPPVPPDSLQCKHPGLQKGAANRPVKP